MKVKPIKINLRTMRIYQRRRCGTVSSMEKAHRMLKEVDPDLTKTVASFRPFYVK